MKWFGSFHGAPYELIDPHVETPVGIGCGWCGEVITAHDDGIIMPCVEFDKPEVVLHYECHFRQIVGGLNHQRGKCLCCGGDAPPDPPEISKRDAAICAMAYHMGKSHGR